MANNNDREDMILKLYDLVLNPKIKEVERSRLIKAKTELEKDHYFPRVMNDLERQLRPMAIKGELSEPVSPFYLEIATIGKFEKELGKGLAATTITFG
ncbi:MULTISPECIES: bacteriocin immunity protein [unclassified Enterococcus]|uniref:bacteriocin immunity protein n=1 Tax=unclassified Enterococcus TaxID=2608891 RepID=UPI0013E9A912|nr:MULTISPECIES: bacteriocin immunity protein [unclassified Enterococcus]